jgi:hypothetical protein
MNIYRNVSYKIVGIYIEKSMYYSNIYYPQKVSTFGFKNKEKTGNGMAN